MSSENTVNRRAVLVFADLAPSDFSRIGWLRRFAPVLALHANCRDTASADLHLFSTEPLLLQRLLPGAAVHSSRGVDPGSKLRNALRRLRLGAYEQVAIVRCDHPLATAEAINNEFGKLDSSTLVIEKDDQGDCWFIGLHAHNLDRLDELLTIHDISIGDVVSPVQRADIPEERVAAAEMGLLDFGPNFDSQDGRELDWQNLPTPF